MSKDKSFKIAALAASIALAMGTTAAMASTAAPAAGQLPGKGSIVIGGTGVSASTIGSDGSQTISLGNADGNPFNAVIKWGTGSDINATGTGGFNIGSGASLGFTNHTSNGSVSGQAAVLNIDSSGNASQIFGSLSTDSNTTVYVANSNGVIVGAGATVSGNVALIANKLGATAATDFASDPNPEYDGTGGDVTVQKGANLSGTILVSGGGNVNVDLGALSGLVELSAGVPSFNAGSFAANNANAALNVTGALAGGAIEQFESAGTASNSGVLDVSAPLFGYSVAGLFTNTGMLTLPSNNAGPVHNLGQLTTTGGATFNGTLTNDGTYAAGGSVTVNGGDLVNNGTISGAGNVNVYDGNVTNKGTLSDVNYIDTRSDANYTAGADYSITNAGTIAESATSDSSRLYIAANHDGRDADTANDTTGSFTNTGTLKLYASGHELDLFGNDNVSLGGSVKAGSAVVSADNTLAKVFVSADNGVFTLSTPLAFSGTSMYDFSVLSGQQVELMADVTGVDNPDYTAYLQVQAGDKMASGYAIRVGNGVALAAHGVYFGGISADVHPNVILQGTVAGNDVEMGWNVNDIAPVSDVFSGPQGGILATGASPYVEFDFTGKVKSAPYLNDSNFRYNYLPITVEGTDPVYIGLNPVAYQTNGTSNGLSAVNLLVNGSAIIDAYLGTPSAVTQSSAVTGVNNWANTHLVVQATGSIETGGGSGSFYWPGYVYLGNIATNADGSAAPGTLGLGSIVLDGNFNNVLPGDTSGAGGVHFITQYPLQMNGHSVTTNANSWINFGTDSLTAAYAAGVQGAGLFFGGVQGSGNVVNYGDLDPSLFHTQAPVSTK